MAASNTLAGLINFNDQNVLDLGITDLLDDSPLLAAINAVPASNGTLHKYLKQSTASSASFRAVSEGALKTYAADTLVTDTLTILDASFSMDVALVDAYRGGRDAYMDKELTRALKQAFFEVEMQILQGTNNDSGGFAGLQDNGQLNAVADTMVINAGGSTATEQTSCYLIRSDDDDCSVVAGNDGRVEFDTDNLQIIEKVVNPGTDNKTYPAYYVAVTAYYGFQIGAARSAARIANIHASDSNAQLTDAMIYDALSQFPAARQPTHIVMNRAALKMLRDSRTATNATGAPVPRPTEVEGIPVVTTDAITSTEAVLS